MRRRVVITGLGALSSAGANVDEARDNLIAGQDCLSPIADPRAAHLKARYAGLLRNFDAPAAALPPAVAGFDQHVQMALVAAREALAAARLDPRELGRRMGLVFSTCSGPMLLIEAHYERIIRGDCRISASELFAKQYHAGARVLAHALGIRGFSTTVVTACTASTGAIALAADLIRCGMLDAALAGGSDAFSISTLAGFDGLKATAEGKCAPFSKPAGLNLGEAAALVCLETPEAAHGRGVAIRAEVLGYGMSNDAYHCSAPEPGGRGLAMSMERALRDARLPLEGITYINAHGTGTEANDKAETRAIRRVFGDAAGRVPVSSTKSMIGHCLGAAGAMEAIAAIAGGEAGVLPPTANFSEPREGCPLDYVPDIRRAWDQPRVFLSNNAAFGGHNASLIVGLPDDTPVAPSAAAGTEKIFVTACGVVSSLGVGSNAILEAMRHGRTGLQSVPLPGLPPVMAGMVPDEAVEKFDRRLDLRQMDRSSRWATVATRLVLQEAGFPNKPAALANLGFYLHLATGPSWAESEFLTSLLQNNHQVSQVMAFPYIVPSSVAGNVCRTLRLTGHNVTLSGGPGAGLLGLGPAVAALRNGHVEAILTGAVDELSERILTDRVMAGAAQPEGIPPGEGAVVLLLETEGHAKARGATILAEVCSAAFATEGEHCQQPDENTGALEVMLRAALDQAHLPARDLTAVCGCGPTDRIRRALKHVCPDWTDPPMKVAPATGYLEAAQSLLELAVVLQTPPVRQHPAEHLLAIASSPTGVNGVVVFRRCQPTGRRCAR